MTLAPNHLLAEDVPLSVWLIELVELLAALATFAVTSSAVMRWIKAAEYEQGQQQEDRRHAALQARSGKEW